MASGTKTDTTAIEKKREPASQNKGGPRQAGTKSRKRPTNPLGKSNSFKPESIAEGNEGLNQATKNPVHGHPIIRAKKQMDKALAVRKQEGFGKKSGEKSSSSQKKKGNARRFCHQAEEGEPKE